MLLYRSLQWSSSPLRAFAGRLFIRNISITTTTRTREMSTAPRTYRDAVALIDSLQSNAESLELFRKSGKQFTQQSTEEIIEYLNIIGYTTQDLNRLNVIHVTGTKGKGSTCAFVESILRRERPDWKIGLYTSPHVADLRDRIRINGKPISEEDFTKYFFEAVDRLRANTQRKYETTPILPMYFRMITIAAFHVFMQLKVDATILEVGIGGAYDCTNIVPKPIVTGVTALGIDHVNVLGNTLEQIAWHKGGIYKEGVPAYTVNQLPEALEVLENRARELKASSFTVIPLVPGITDIKLGIAGKHQYQNASLAVHLGREFTRRIEGKTGPTDIEDVTLTPTVTAALQATTWPGRCQKLNDPKYTSTTWFLDGAHTVDSLEFCVEWFFSPDAAFGGEQDKPLRVLIFNCTSGRDGPAFLERMINKSGDQWKLYRSSGGTDVKSYFDHVVFSTNWTESEDDSPNDPPPALTNQRALAAAWSTLIPDFPKENIHVLPTINAAVALIRDLERTHTETRHVQVLATGSLHLVGGIINVAGLRDLVM